MRDALSILDSGNRVIERKTHSRFRAQPGRRRARAHTRRSDASHRRRRPVKMCCGMSTISSAKAIAPHHFCASDGSFFCAMPPVAKIAGKSLRLLQISSEERRTRAGVADLLAKKISLVICRSCFEPMAELGYKQNSASPGTRPAQRWRTRSGLLPIEQLLSEVSASSSVAGANASRPEARPSIVCDLRGCLRDAAGRGVAGVRPNHVSPFAADSARKGTPRQESVRGLSSRRRSANGGGGKSECTGDHGRRRTANLSQTASEPELNSPAEPDPEPDPEPRLRAAPQASQLASQPAAAVSAAPIESCKAPYCRRSRTAISASWSRCSNRANGRWKETKW